jgi:hypothetical protein
LSSKRAASHNFALLLSLALNLRPKSIAVAAAGCFCSLSSLLPLLLLLLLLTFSTLQITVLEDRVDECTPARAGAGGCWGNGAAPPSLQLWSFSTLEVL